MKKIFKMGIVLTFMLFILTGCTNTEYNVQINEDGSGKVEYTVKYDEEILKSNNITLAEVDEYKFLDSLKKVAEENGYKTENIKKDKYTLGYKATKEFQNIEEFKIEESINGEYFDIQDDTGIKIEKSFFKTKYHQSFKISLIPNSEEIIEYINEIKLIYDLPNGKIVTNTAQETSEGNILTWTIKSGETVEVSYCVEKINETPLKFIIVGSILASILVITVIVLVIKKVKKSKKKA